MSCTNPLLALYLGINPDSGKRILKILPKRPGFSYEDYKNRYGSESIIQLACGQCESCIEARSRNWSYRCILEASNYEKNCFVTLTYNDDCIPHNIDNKYILCKKDVQNFIKRLRKYVGHEIKYFLCGEYGTNTFRPHYHLIIFGWCPDDLKFLSKGKHGGFTFTSQTLSNIWKFGFSLVGDVSFESCAYVARYCQKKLLKHLTYDVPEFCLMSKNLGYSFFIKNYEKIYSYDLISFDFGKVKKCMPFKYFDKCLEKIDPKLLEDVKNKRISKSNLLVCNELMLHAFDSYDRLLTHKSNIKKDSFSKLKRGGF